MQYPDTLCLNPIETATCWSFFILARRCAGRLDCVPVTCEGCGFLHCIYSETAVYFTSHRSNHSQHMYTRMDEDKKPHETKLKQRRKSCGGDKKKTIMIFNTFQRSISVYGTTCDSSYIWMLVVAIVLTPGGPWPVGLHYKQELIWSTPTRRTLLFQTEYCVAFFPLLDYREFQCDPFINWDAKVTLSPIFATEWALFVCFFSLLQ